MTERRAITIGTDADIDGDDITVTLTIDLPPGSHIEPHEPAEPYLIPTVVTVDGVRDPTIRYPEPTVKIIGEHGYQLTVLEGVVTVTIAGRRDERAASVNGTLTYQPCIDGACHRPRSLDWHAPLNGPTSYSVLASLS